MWRKLTPPLKFKNLRENRLILSFVLKMKYNVKLFLIALPWTWQKFKILSTQT